MLNLLAVGNDACQRLLHRPTAHVVASRSTSEMFSTPAKVLTQQAEGLTHILGERRRVFHGREVAAVLGFREEPQIVETRLRPAP